MALLEARGVGKSFGALRALDGVDLTVRAYTFHGLIGPNGSGKSTLLKAIAGVHIPDEGRIVFDSDDITAAAPADRSRRGPSLKFQITSVLPELSVYDNILLRCGRCCARERSGGCTRRWRTRSIGFVS